MSVIVTSVTCLSLILSVVALPPQSAQLCPSMLESIPELGKEYVERKAELYGKRGQAVIELYSQMLRSGTEGRLAAPSSPNCGHQLGCCMPGPVCWYCCTEQCAVMLNCYQRLGTQQWSWELSDATAPVLLVQHSRASRLSRHPI